ncbi:hypothetical protein EYR36_008754 [Pleurotus pulmonarius]|nr:hypothetical protein EYR36_008754 [Pleurotus pulmonarius]
MGVVGPYLLALKEDGDVLWPDNFKLALLLEPAVSSSNVFFTPSLGSSHSGGSVPPSGSSMAPSSIAPSASISSVGVSNAGGLPPAPAYITAAYLAKPNLIPFAQLLEVPPSLVPNTKPNVTPISAFDHWRAASDAPDRLRAAYNVYNAKVPRLPPLPAFPSVEDARAVYVNTTSFSNYSKLFPFTIQHPAVLSYLQGDVPSGSAEYAALWGALKPGLKTLGIVMKKLTDEKEKEEKKAKKKAGPSKSNFCLQAYMMLLVVWFLLGLVPCVAAAPKQDPFPNMLLTEFAQSIQDNFGPKIKLSTVLMLLMTLLDGCSIKVKLSEHDFASLFTQREAEAVQTPQQHITMAGKKLSRFSRSLSLASHTSTGVLKRKLRPVSTTSVQPVILITPMVMACPTLTCNNHSLTQELRDRDTSKVTLLQGSQCHLNIPVLAGRCYHERFTQNNGDDVCLYLNDAKYLKVGKSVWVDRLVSRAIVNANYSFHASTAAITEFCHSSFVQPSGGTFKLSRRQVWKAFVAESIRHMASFNNWEIVFESNLSIDALVAAAYV